jgi:ATP-binding cassette subfamily F protein 3
MITVTGLTKTYGTQVLFENAAFTVGPGERAGLVGRNGSGKTTLFRLLLGEEQPDSGAITIPKGFAMGHLSQHIRFRGATVLEEASRDLRHDEDGTDRTFKVKSILHGLGFSQDNFARSPHELSGGYQIRLNLARLLASEPDVLLLDEPTNYLDILSIRWLQRFLQAWKNELILITHDRDFMDSVTTHTMAIHRRVIRKIPGSTHKLYAQILQDEEVYEQTRIHEEKIRRDLEQFINRFRAQASRAKAVQSKIKALEKRGSMEKIAAERGLDFEFPALEFHGKWLIEAHDMDFAYTEGTPQLIESLNLAVGRRDRIAVIGRNGKGKTTLLNLLAGELSPSAGSITVHDNVEIGYFGQTNVEKLNADATVEEEIGSALSGPGLKRARTICGIMLFEGDKALKKVSVLSGGEKSRVLLGKLIATPSNLLILDEPTNHLDMESIDSLVEAMEQFKGAVIVATHSEMILHAVANRLVVFDDDRVTLFEGSYRDFLERVGWKSEEKDPGSDGENNEKEKRRVDRKELRRLRAEFIANRSKTLTPLKERIDAIELKIMQLEQQMDEENGVLLKATEVGDGKKIVALSISIHNARRVIDESFEELEKASSVYHASAREFEEQFRELDSLDQ